MIPKIIHYCWFGPKKYSRTVKKCMETWHRLMPDYEFMLWNETNSPMDHPFVRSAYAAKKYAFVADYVRFWALFNYGGIYLDTDMYAIKRFDELLENECFAGYENDKDINVALLGAKKYNPLIEQLLHLYDSLEFDVENMMSFVIPQIVTPKISRYATARVYPSDYFYPFPFADRMKQDFMAYKTENTFAIHLWNLSWKPLWQQYLSFAIKEYKRMMHLYKRK